MKVYTMTIPFPDPTSLGFLAAFLNISSAKLLTSPSPPVAFFAILLAY